MQRFKIRIAQHYQREIEVDVEAVFSLDGQITALSNAQLDTYAAQFAASDSTRVDYLLTGITRVSDGVSW